jgi:hypothetical protein
MLLTIFNHHIYGIDIKYNLFLTYVINVVYICNIVNTCLKYNLLWNVHIIDVNVE